MKSTRGRPRKLTDAQVAVIMAWHRSRKTRQMLADELGVSLTTVRNAIKCGGVYKLPSKEHRAENLECSRRRMRQLRAQGIL